MFIVASFHPKKLPWNHFRIELGGVLYTHFQTIAMTLSLLHTLYRHIKNFFRFSVHILQIHSHVLHIYLHSINL
jgi:hypothetical protein